MTVNVYEWFSHYSFTIITVIGAVGLIGFLWARFGRKVRGRYDR